MKTCKDCGELKVQDDFYPTQGECKECTKLRVRRREALKRLDPHWVDKERKRSRDKYHRLNYKDKYKSSQACNRETYTRNYKNKFPEKYKAKILSQRIEVPKGFERHHWNYNEDFAKDIIPLSVKNHNKLHRFIKYDKELFMFRVVEPLGDFVKDQLLSTKEEHINYYLELKTSKLWL